MRGESMPLAATTPVFITEFPLESLCSRGYVRGPGSAEEMKLEEVFDVIQTGRRGAARA